MPVIGTFGGRLLNPADTLNLGEENLPSTVIWECAHAISMLCRYGGQTSRFYSVGMHTLLLLEIVNQLEKAGALLENANDDLKVALLMHDFHEGYIVDLPRPLKKMLPEYCKLEKQIESEVAQILKCDSFSERTLKIRDAFDIHICEFVEITFLEVGVNLLYLDARQGFHMFFNHLMYEDIIPPSFTESVYDVSGQLEDFMISLLGMNHNEVVNALHSSEAMLILKARLGVSDE